ncbi:hypothetical protein ACHQM5_028264 [Ranunculus cassubicifolius]
MFFSGVSHFFLLLLTIIASIHNTSSFANGRNDNETMMTPLIEPKKMMETMILHDTRRKLGSFQICALCTCCGGPKGICIPSPCCYAINCNIPNRPFGFCSFKPKTCNCFGCHL